MVSYIVGGIGGYQDVVRIENNCFLLCVNICRWFPESKQKLTQLLKLIYHNDNSNETGPILDRIVKYLTDFSKQEYVNDRLRRRLEKNIEQIKIFNGLYGGT